MMIALEDTRGTGRVSLAKFYSGGYNGEGMSHESVAYLRQLGALDESDPRRLRVIIPNYISGPNNCAAASSLHTVCCISECDAILAEVEREIAAPVAARRRFSRSCPGSHRAPWTPRETSPR